MAVARPTLGHSQGDSITNTMSITAYVHIQPEGHREPRNEVGSLSPVKRLAGFEPGTFQFLVSSKRLEKFKLLAVSHPKQFSLSDQQQTTFVMLIKVTSARKLFCPIN